MLLLLTGCSQPISLPTPSNLDLARGALITFFDTLHKGDYYTAATYYGGSYYALQVLYPETTNQQDPAALFKAACEASRYDFYCWKVKEVVAQEQIASDRYLFTVRFEDDNGNLLTGGDNQTPVPCLPSESCPRSQYTYIVLKVQEKFLVQELPVCANCWP
jgi:hypothetical protein